MEKEANYFTVGVFVSVTLLALVGFSIWLAGVHDFGHHDRYTVYFTEPVSGLNDESVVKYKGVEVGTRRADFLVEYKVILETKAVIQLDEVDLAQALNYLEAFDLPTGLLINFGATSLQFKRLLNKKYRD